MIGYIHSLQSLGTVDGPGLRAVVFAAGCPYRCIYCHNPDTWSISNGSHTDTAELAERISRLYPYIKNGGVTFSGGEPCMQAEFFTELADKMHALGLHVALDTSGAIADDKAMRLVDACDLVLLDIKFTTDDDYKKYTGGSIVGALKILEHREKTGKPVWVRQVIVPGINDKDEDAIALAELMQGYTCIEKTELLPFKKLCLEKYERMGIDFPLKDTPAADEKEVKRLHGVYLEHLNSL